MILRSCLSNIFISRKDTKFKYKSRKVFLSAFVFTYFALRETL